MKRLKRVGWVKWRSALRVFCDHKIPIELKEKNLQDFYKTSYALSYWNVGMLRSKIFIK